MDNKVWDTQANQASWVIKRILQGGKWLEESGLNIEETMEVDRYNIKIFTTNSEGNIGRYLGEGWYVYNQGQPKWTFILFQAIHEKLFIEDRLEKWGLITDTTCSLCNNAPENHQHLFFECTQASKIWQKVLGWMNIKRGSMGWL